MPRCSFDFTQTSHQSSARELQAFSDASLGSSTIKFKWILNTRIVRPHHDFHVRRNRSSGTLKRRVKLKWQMSKMPRWKKFAHQKLCLLKCLERWNLLLVKFQRFPAYQKPQKTTNRNLFEVIVWIREKPCDEHPDYTFRRIRRNPSPHFRLRTIITWQVMLLVFVDLSWHFIVFSKFVCKSSSVRIRRKKKQAQHTRSWLVKKWGTTARRNRAKKLANNLQALKQSNWN